MLSLVKAMAVRRPVAARPLGASVQSQFQSISTQAQTSPLSPQRRLVVALKSHPAGLVLLARNLATAPIPPRPPRPSGQQPRPAGQSNFAPRPGRPGRPQGFRPPRNEPEAEAEPTAPDANDEIDEQYIESIDEGDLADLKMDGIEVRDEKQEAAKAMAKREIKKSPHVHTSDWDRFYQPPTTIPEVEKQLTGEFTAKQLRLAKKSTAEVAEMMQLVDRFDDDDLNVLFGAYADVDDPNVRQMFEYNKLEEFLREELEKEALAAKDPAKAIKEKLEDNAEIAALEAELAKLIAAEKAAGHSPLDNMDEAGGTEPEFSEEDTALFTEDLAGDDYFLSYEEIPEAEVEERTVASWSDPDEPDVDVDHELDHWEAHPELSEEQKDWDALFLDLHSPYDPQNKLQVKPKVAAILDNLIKQNIERHHIETVEEVLKGPERKPVDLRELDPEEPVDIEDPWSSEADEWADANPQDEYDDVPDNYGEPLPELSALDAAIEAKRRLETFGVVKRPEMKDYETPVEDYTHRPTHFGTLRDEAPFLTEVDDNYQHDQWEELLLRKRLDPFNRDYYVPEHSFVLSDVAKETIFLLNLWEPEKWGYRELARTFAIETDRVRAIIRLKRMEHYRRHHGLLYQDFDPEEDAGVLTYWDPVFHPFHYGDVNEKFVSDFQAIAERADDDRYWKRIANYKVPPRDPTLPAADGKLTDKHLPVQRKNRFPLVISDISKKGENLVVKIRQTDGAIRNPVDEELVRGIQIENPWHKDRQRTMRRGGNYW